jgi:hypothetical protein
MLRIKLSKNKFDLQKVGYHLIDLKTREKLYDSFFLETYQ